MKKNIIFIDIHNNCHTQIAEAFARLYGNEKVDVYSAGSYPTVEIDELAVEIMNEVGYDLKTQRTKSTINLDDVSFDFAIRINCNNDCPFIIARHHVDWDIIVPSINDQKQYRKMREEILKKVIKFLEQWP